MRWSKHVYKHRSMQMHKHRVSVSDMVWLPIGVPQTGGKKNDEFQMALIADHYKNETPFIHSPRANHKTMSFTTFVALLRLSWRHTHSLLWTQRNLHVSFNITDDFADQGSVIVSNCVFATVGDGFLRQPWYELGWLANWTQGAPLCGWLMLW